MITRICLAVLFSVGVLAADLASANGLAVANIASVNGTAKASIASVNGLTIAGGSFTDPSDYTPYIWWAATAGVTNYSGTAAADEERIASVLDQSGNGKHLLGPASSGSSLKFQTSIQNGLPVLESGTSIWMSRALGETLAQPITYFIVVRVISSGTHAYWLDGTNSSASERIYLGKTNGDVPSGGATSSLTDTGNTLANPSTHIFALVVNGASSKMYKNGVEVEAGDVGAGGLTGITVGNLYTHTNGGGQMGEILVFDEALDSTEIANMFTWLNAKWAVY
jgi:hypothetical protein